MNNLIAITPNCFIIRTQAGFKKLCKMLGCNPNKGNLSYNHHNEYRYEVYQITNDQNAIEMQYVNNHCDCNGKPILDENGNQKTYTITHYKQYPIKYPCILSFHDLRLERSMYYFYITYVFDDLKIIDFKDNIKMCKEFREYEQ